MKKGILFGLAIVSLLIMFAVGSKYFKGEQAQKIESAVRNDNALFARDYSQTLGSKDAKVVISEFLDPGCETCRAFHPFLKQVLAHYSGKVKLVIRYAPLHHGSDDMVRILEASRQQGKYWETLEIMYESQPYWASHSNPQPDQIWQFLPKAGLDIEKIKKHMHAPEIGKIIAQDVADAGALNVKKTPQFFVNGRPLITFGSEQLVELIQSEVVKNYP